MAGGSATERVDWVDAAKGLCIIMVVMVHAVLGVELAAGERGFMHLVVSFARPFRMPDFFLISGLFLGLVLDRPWLRYSDRKVVHFAYFYVLWLVIQFAFKAPGMVVDEGASGAAGEFLTALVQPFGTLWFIYVLPVFFLFTRLVKGLPIGFVFAWAAVMEILPVDTGAVVFDEFCARYVYFFAGYAFAPQIFRVASWVRANPVAALCLVALWAPLDAWLVFTPTPQVLASFLQADLGYTGATGGLSELPFVSLPLGFAGAMVIVSAAALLTQLPRTAWLTWLGAHSIVVYLAFFLPMATARAVLLRTGLVPDIGLMGILVTAAGVTGAVLIYGLVQWSGWGRFLFERPRWAYLDRPMQKGLRRADA